MAACRRHAGPALRPGLVITLEPVTPAGRDRVARWLREPAVAQWWGSRGAAEARIAAALSTPSAICRMVALDKLPVGWAQAVDAGLGVDEGGPRLAPGTAECMVFIGEAAHRGQGHWGTALDLLAREVLSTTLAIACAVAVPVRNERVVRAAERAGFRWTAIHDDAGAGPMWVMLRGR